jgi:hypothetical protein
VVISSNFYLVFAPFSSLISSLLVALAAGTWMGYSPDPIFLQKCPTEVKALFSGENLYMAQVSSFFNFSCHCDQSGSEAAIS